MKIKVTRKEMKQSFNIILGVGYCDMSTLLRNESPLYYSTRAEGWACDYYIVDDVLISTGYAPLNTQGTKANYELIREYESKAKAIYYNYDLEWDEQNKQIQNLLNEFINIVKGDN